MSFFNTKKNCIFFHVCTKCVVFFCLFATLDVNVDYETMSIAFKTECNLMMIAVAALVAPTTICAFSSVSIALTTRPSAFRFTIALYLKLREIQQQLRACKYAATLQIKLNE